jgi:hypothetical protein
MATNTPAAQTVAYKDDDCCWRRALYSKTALEEVVVTHDVSSVRVIFPESA